MGVMENSFAFSCSFEILPFTLHHQIKKTTMNQKNFMLHMQMCCMPEKVLRKE
jgi:hypothetical protein